MKIFEKTNIPLLSQALKAYAMRHRAIASNIANIATPGYQPQQISFEEELHSAWTTQTIRAERTHERHIPVGSSELGEAVPRVVTVDPSDPDSLASGVNSVDIDREMGALAENQLRFRFVARMLSDTFKGIQKSIRGQA